VDTHSDLILGVHFSEDKETLPSFEADRDVRKSTDCYRCILVFLQLSTASVDEHLQDAGADAFNKFSRLAYFMQLSQ
jgi:hypothetical protein